MGNIQSYEKKSTLNQTFKSSLKFKNKKWEISDEEHVNYFNNTISFLNYNIWYDDHNIINRNIEIINLFIKYSPDFICLQEVTDIFFDFIKNNNFIRKYYYISNNLHKGYDVLILSKYNFSYQSLDFDSNQNRKLLFTEINFNGYTGGIATAHFESLDFSVLHREDQIKTSFKILEKYDFAFLMGDFNFNANNSKEEKNIDEKYYDAWITYANLNNLTDDGQLFHQ